MRVLITGGSGFIGSHLAEYFQGRAEVRILDNLRTGFRHNLDGLNVEFIEGSICDRSLVSQAVKGVDYVFHLAALAEIIPSIKNPKKYFKNNVIGTLKVVEAVNKVKIKKLIYAASSSCYGTPKKLPTSEKDRIDLKNPYAVTKYIGEEIIMKYAEMFKMPNISFRFFNVYGARLNVSGQYGAVISNFLSQRKNNKPLTIVGNGKQTRDFIHVDDVCKSIDKAIDLNIGWNVQNICTGIPLSVLEFARLQWQVLEFLHRQCQSNLAQYRILIHCRCCLLD